MRNILLLLASWSLLAAACSRSTSPDNGCIQRIVIKPSDPGLDAWKKQTADSIMDAHHIDHSNTRYYRLDTSTFGIVAPYAIRLDQYTNGLRIFNDDMLFIFPKNIPFDRAGFSRTKGTTLDTIPFLSLSRLRAMFTADLRRNAQTVTPGLTDSCYKAEFGYYNLSTAEEPEHLVKAWRVTINYSSSLWYWPYGYGYPYDAPPIAYYRDNGQLIGFAGNIIIN